MEEGGTYNLKILVYCAGFVLWAFLLLLEVSTRVIFFPQMLIFDI